VLIHGGAAASDGLKDSAAYTSWGRLVAASGMAAVTFNWDDTRLSDLVALITYLRENEKTLKIDTLKLCLAAFSAGVDPSLLAVLGDKLGPIDCFVGYYGSYSISSAVINNAAIKKVPSMLILHGTEDEVFPLRGAESCVDSATKLKLPAKLLIHSKGVHSFELRNDDNESKSLLKETIEFLKQALMPADKS
jgi:predicted esterase